MLNYTVENRNAGKPLYMQWYYIQVSHHMQSYAMSTYVTLMVVGT